MVQKVVDYKIITGRKFSILAREVTEGLKEDWVPSGPVIIHGDDIAQVMVKFEDIDD